MLLSEDTAMGEGVFLVYVHKYLRDLNINKKVTALLKQLSGIVYEVRES